MKRKLFCEIHPITYRLSINKNKIKRYLKRTVDINRYSKTKSDNLPISVYKHKSLIRRTLGQVDMALQNNKAKNLSIAIPKVDGVIIYPGETFSFWQLVGNCTASKGYLDGLVVKNNGTGKGVGGGLCQFTNLIHWMVLHTPLTITEHHHHNSIDMFPDYKRVLPFGTGTSVFHNYLDYQFENTTENVFQIRVRHDEKYLIGEIRAEKPLMCSYHIVEENHFFEKIGENYYRNNEIFQRIIDKKTGNELSKKMILKSRSLVLYDLETDLTNPLSESV